MGCRPWGELRAANSVVPTTMKYTGQRNDSYINLYWYGSRWYDVLGEEIPFWVRPAASAVDYGSEYWNQTVSRQTDTNSR